MSKELFSREARECPGCHQTFAFLEYHVPHCKLVTMQMQQVMAKKKKAENATR